MFLCLTPSGFDLYAFQREVTEDLAGRDGQHIRVVEMASCWNEWGRAKRAEGVLVQKWPVMEVRPEGLCAKHWATV